MLCSEQQPVIWGHMYHYTIALASVHYEHVLLSFTRYPTLPCTGTHIVKGFLSNNKPYNISADLILMAF